MMKKKMRTKILCSMMSVSVLLSLSSMASAYDIKEPIKGNVPIKFMPSSNITFDANGDYKVTYVADVEPVSNETGEEIGGNLRDENPEYYEALDRAFKEELSHLPVYPYEEYYIAGEGAVAQYDQNGELIRVRGDCEYYSTIDQYMIDGSLPSGKYIGTYGEFTRITGNTSDSASPLSRVAARETGRFTTFGDNWPVIDSKEWPDCNTDPVPDYGKHGPKYGDRIGTHNNKLYIGDVALKKASGVPYDAFIDVTVEASDTNGHGSITKSMRVRDTMSSSADSILDIWRWDSPEWFKGTPQKPDTLYFGQKYKTSLSFSNTSNEWVYNKK